MCQTTPALPLLAAASTVVPTALVTAKYWCGFAIRFARPSESSSKATKLRWICRNRSGLHEPVDAGSSSSDTDPVVGHVDAGRDGRPSSSTFHGEKWFSGVNGVP